jgi:type I restriction enzyme S subunit
MKPWTQIPLGELCEVTAGGTPSRAVASNFGGDIPWVKIGDMVQGRVVTTEERLSRSGLETSAAKILPAGTVLMSIFATIGRTAVLCVDAATNQAIVGITPRNADVLRPEYLRRFLDSQASSLERRARGVAQVNINSSLLKAVPVPLPPLPEQRRIAEILDKADALRAKRRAALAQLDTLTQSIFLDMFGDPATNPRGWRESMLLGDVADIVSGVTIGRKLDGKSTRTVPYLAVVNVQDRHIDLSVTKTTEATEDEIQRYRLERSDLLLTEGGDPDKLGRGSLWNDELAECIHQNHVFRVRLRSKELTPLFLNWLVGSQRGKKYFLRSAKQTTGIASINMTQLRSFPLLVPPLSRQHDFAKQVSAVDALKTTHLAGIAEVDALFASLQHRAFRGEL